MLPVRSFLFALVCLCGVLTATAAPAPDSATPREKAEAFFDTIIQGDAAKAFDTLLAGSSISANKPEANSRLRVQTQTGLSVYGRALGYDLVETRNFGNSLTRLVYILKLEKYPLTWEFFFYRSGGTWMPIDVRFNDKLDVYRYDRTLTTGSDSPAS